jgi:CheY-like chemotaxis protein
LARKILLADDSVTAQNMGRRILSDAGYEVTTVNNGSAALKKIAESKPDLIILDVYMPGYGGLEVCQRLRESKETARIPILLTVGKLEPFKPEEARRVRADAFIVKPFEASELLTALTKLEDRIVPQPAPYKPGRFAKAMEALDADSTSNEYGDLESGWKNRLKIPVPQSHGRDIEPEEEAEQPEPRKPEVRAEQKPVEAPAAVPRDITPEEIAAINAASAAFGTQIPTPVVEPEVASVAAAIPVSEPAANIEETPPRAIADAGDEVAATSATAATVEETPAELNRVDEEQRNEAPVAAEAVQADAVEMATIAAAESQPDPPAPVQEVPSVAPVEAPKPEERDDFAAALESLTPSNGHGTLPSGPRWTAELAAITDAESALILEQEMQKAVAAMAAMNSEESAQSPAAAESSAPASDAVHDEPAEAPMAEYAISESQEASTSLVAAMTEVMADTTTQAATHEAALPTVAELVDSILPRVVTESATPEPEGAAFAAAAAAGAETISQSAAPSEVSQSSTSASNADERQRESELAAAWESWKQIRESVVEPQLKSQSVSPVAETLAPQVEQLSSPQLEAEEENGGQEESVASIVDSVLADLKPRLMEEISRKMGKDKDKKRR